MKSSKILLNISAFICYIYGALYLFSLVFIPIGIYCFIGAKKFAFRAEHLFESFSVDNNKLKGYVIFASIACFPLGLISIIPYYMIVASKIKVSNHVEENQEIEPIIETITDGQEREEVTQIQQSEKVEAVETNTEITEEEKKEKLKKLENFKEKGIITEEEYEMAKNQLNIKE